MTISRVMYLLRSCVVLEVLLFSDGPYPGVMYLLRSCVVWEVVLFSDGPYPRLCISLEVVLCGKCCCLVMDHIPGYVSP